MIIKKDEFCQQSLFWIHRTLKTALSGEGVSGDNKSDRSHPGADPGFGKGVHMYNDGWGFALLILSHFT